MPSYQRKGGDLEGVPSPISGPNKKDTLEEGEETPSEKTVANVTEEDNEDVLPPEVREKLKGSQAPSQGLYKKDNEELVGSKAPSQGPYKKDK